MWFSFRGGANIGGGDDAGAGRNRDGDRAYGHWFDGDGHVTKVGCLIELGYIPS